MVQSGKMNLKKTAQMKKKWETFNINRREHPFGCDYCSPKMSRIGFNLHD